MRGWDQATPTTSTISAAWRIPLVRPSLPPVDRYTKLLGEIGEHRDAVQGRLAEVAAEVGAAIETRA